MKVKLKPPFILNDLDITRVKLSKLSYHLEYYAEETDNEYLILGELKMKKSLFNTIEENMPTKEQVLEAASTSKEAKDALVKLFPKYFEDDKYVDLTKESIGNFLCIRENGKYKHKGFYLVGQYDWEITKDDRGVLVLLPTKKVV